MNYYSQYNQDEFLNKEIFKNKERGTFVDIGAHNGISLSNTFFFEKELNWTGLCIEPNPRLYNILCENRSSININGCAWYENDVKIFRLIEGYSEMLSGILDSYDQKHIDRIERECIDKNSKYIDVEVQCYDINKLLIDNKLKNIDLVSIDTEGSEYEILKCIDYDLINIGVIVVENNYKENNVENFLKSKGYKLYSKIKIDDIYIKDGYKY